MKNFLLLLAEERTTSVVSCDMGYRVELKNELVNDFYARQAFNCVVQFV